MNRRKLFGFFAAAPVGVAGAVAAIKDAVAKPVPSAEPILGELRVTFSAGVSCSPVGAPNTHSVFDPGHSHNIFTTVAIPEQQIYDGDKWVALNSFEGVEAHNKALRTYERSGSVAPSRQAGKRRSPRR